MRILVIEDERTLAGFIEQSLRAEGHAVTVCHDGESGEAKALTGDYALVLLDLTLPSNAVAHTSPGDRVAVVSLARPTRDLRQR